MATPAATTPFRKDCLKGKVALITGGATGIGFGIATQLGSHGAKIAISGRRQNVLDEAVAKLQSMGIDAFCTTGDVRDANQCISVIEKVSNHFHQLDILVNNAAGNFVVSGEDLTSNGFNTVLSVDLLGCFHMCKAALPVLKSRDSSTIVNITATLQYKAQPFQLHAASAKAGIDVLTKTLGVEWAEYGVRCVGIAPGPIAGTVGGPTGRVFGNASGLTESRSVDAIRPVVPAGRYGSVDDIGLTTVFLCSDAAAFITSEVVVVDGGQWHGTSAQYVRGKDIVRAKSTQERKTHKGGVVKPKL